MRYWSVLSGQVLFIELDRLVKKGDLPTQDFVDKLAKS
ncbi:hypothetical protein MUGA111182_01830 [Mucilaginibacter galii]